MSMVPICNDCIIPMQLMSFGSDYENYKCDQCGNEVYLESAE